jgi:hypothetical protein
MRHQKKIIIKKQKNALVQLRHEYINMHLETEIKMLSNLWNKN